MRKLLMVLLSLILLSCAEEKKEPKDLTTFILEDAAIIVKLQDPDLFFSHLANNDFLGSNSSHPLQKNLRARLFFLRHFEHKQPALLTFSSEKAGKTSFTFIQRGLPSINLDSVQNKSVETFSADYGELIKYTIDDLVTYATHIDSVLILSDSRNNIETILRGEAQLPHSEDFKTALKASSEDKPVILINHSSFSSLTANLLPKAKPKEFGNFSNWTSLDMDLSSTAIKLNGITLASDTLPRTINLFKGVAPTANELAKVAPAGSQGFFSFSFENFQTLGQNLSAEITETEEAQLLSNATEAGSIYFEEASIFAVRALNIEIPTSAFQPQRSIAEEFQGIAIYDYKGPGFNFLKELASTGTPKYFLFLDQFVLFGEELQTLKEVIASFHNENTLAKSAAFQNAFQHLSTEASLLWVTNNRNFKERLKGAVAEEYIQATEDLHLENYPIAAVQFIYQGGYAHVHAVLAKSETRVSTNGVSKAASISLDAPLAAPPVFFNNHRTEGLDIAVQDIRNTLYLISSDGKIHWKKKLESPILGKIQQVDLYKNGRYQLAFATENSVQIIDREGNQVKPFPLEFRDEVTQPLAIFDYDNNRNYRFLVVQNNNVYMYDSKAKGVAGFKFRKATEEIIAPPKHIRIGRNDYILVQEVSGKLNILSRTGDHRIEVKERIAPSGNEWYEYNKGFASTNSEGALIKIDEKGSISKEDLALTDNHRITATAKTLVTLSDNLLTINGKTVELDFGLYTEPQIFFLNNKIYVSVTDTQAHKVYLFDSNAELLPDFPIYGNSVIDLGNADGDARLELVVTGDEDSVLVYEM